MVPSMDLAPDMRVADAYRLIQRLGQGGHGDAWLALDADGGPVVLKVLRAPPGEAGHLLERFLREARLLTEFEHRHLPRAYGCLSWNDRAVLVLEFIEGTTVADLLRHRARNDAPFEPDEILHFAEQVGSALGYLHQRGVAHRDLKPSNLMNRGPDEASSSIGHVTLLDLGVAKTFGPEAGTLLTTQGRFVGTVAYAPPEQLRGEGEISLASDLFSLASVVYELATLRRAWLRDPRGEPLAVGAPSRNPKNDPFSVAQRIMRQEYVPVAELRPGMRDLDTWFQRAVQPPSEERYGDVDAFLQGLRQALRIRGSTVRATPPTLQDLPAPELTVPAPPRPSAASGSAPSTPWAHARNQRHTQDHAPTLQLPWASSMDSLPLRPPAARGTGLWAAVLLGALGGIAVLLAAHFGGWLGP